MYTRQQELMKEMADMYRLTGEQIEAEITKEVQVQLICSRQFVRLSEWLRLSEITDFRQQQAFFDDIKAKCTVWKVFNAGFMDKTKVELGLLPNGMEQRTRISEVVTEKFKGCLF